MVKPSSLSPIFEILIFFGVTGSARATYYLFPDPQNCEESQRSSTVCATFMYLPALGHTSDNSYKVYESDCDACRDIKVDVYWNFQFCHSNSAGFMKDIDFPVCVLSTENKLKQYQSLSEACNSKETAFYLPGQCPDN